MFRLIARRLLSIILVSVAIIYLVFVAMNLIGTDPVVFEPVPLLEALRLAFSQTTAYLDGLLHLDLGMVPTVSGEQPVSEILWFSYRNSMVLILMSLAFASIVGVLLGTYAALTKGRIREYSVLALSLLGVSIPAFLIAVLLQSAGIKYTVTFGRQLVSMGGFGWDFKHMAMPLIVLAARPIAYITRATFIALSAIMREDYIRTAYAKGLSRQRTVVWHGFRNLAIPVLTAIGVSFRFSLAVLPLVEFIFGWPGVGLRLLEAINNRVPVLVVTFALVIGLTIQFINLLLEISYREIDPRLREIG